MTRAVVKPSLLDALIPVILLISMLAGTGLRLWPRLLWSQPSRTDYLRRSRSPYWD